MQAISAASILAKVHRDSLCRILHLQHPEYGFDVHKGYPTARHLAALQLHGVCPQHRRGFAPVRRLLAGTVDPVALIRNDLSDRWVEIEPDRP